MWLPLRSAYTVSSDRESITIKRIALLGFLLGLMMVMKYALGFVPGIEVITFMVIIFALFLPFKDLMLLIVAFNLSIIAMYGVGTWWVAYWVIWPLDALFTRGLMKFTRNRYVFAVWAFIAGFSVLVYYYFSDLAFFDASFATLNIITALPVNLIEGFVTMILMITLAPKLIRIINQQATGFWPKPLNFTFKPVKWRAFSSVLSVLVVLGAVAGMILLFVFNSFFISWKSREITKTSPPGYITSRDANGYGLMSVDDYNATYASLKPQEMAIAIIAKGEVVKEVVAIYEPQKLIEVMLRLTKFEFKYTTSSLYGEFVQSFRPKSLNSNSPWLHGSATAKNYEDFYPFIFYNSVFASLGVSGLDVKAQDIVEFTYDF